MSSQPPIGPSIGPPAIRSGTPAKTLPYVLRQAIAAGAQGARLELGEVVGIPDARHVTVTITGSQITVPKLSSYTARVGDPVYLLVSTYWTVALGTVATVGAGYSMRKVTPTEVSNTSAWTDLLNGEIIIPGYALSATGQIQLVAGGDLLQNASANRQLQVRLTLGGLVLWSSGQTDQIVQAVDRRGWTLYAMLMATGSLSDQVGGGFFVFGDNNPATVGIGVIHNPSTKSQGPFTTVHTAADMRLPQPLRFEVTLDTPSPSYAMRCVYARASIL